MTGSAVTAMDVVIFSASASPKGGFGGERARDCAGKHPGGFLFSCFFVSFFSVVFSPRFWCRLGAFLAPVWVLF